MGFLDKAKAAAEQAAAKAKEGVEDVQAKRELNQAYNELGKSAYELIESGEIANPRLDATAAKIRTLLAGMDGSDGDSGAEPQEPSEPPA